MKAGGIAGSVESACYEPDQSCSSSAAGIDNASRDSSGEGVEAVTRTKTMMLIEVTTRVIAGLRGSYYIGAQVWMGVARPSQGRCMAASGAPKLDGSLFEIPCLTASQD